MNHARRMIDLGLEAGSDYELGADARVMLDRAMCRYITFLQQMEIELLIRKQPADTILLDIHEARKLKDIFDGAYSVVAHGVGDAL